MLCVRGKNRIQQNQEGLAFPLCSPLQEARQGFLSSALPRCGFVSEFLTQSSNRVKRPPYPLILKKLFFLVIIEPIKTPIKTCDLHGQKLDRQMSDSQINMDTLPQGWW